MPWFVDLQNQYGKDGLVILGVAMDDSEPGTIAKFANELGVNYTVLLGTDKVSDAYGDVQYLPTTFFIGRNGAIVDKLTGLLDRKDIEDDVKKTLGTDPGAPLRPANVQQNQAQVQPKPSLPQVPDPRDATR
jgi:glutathione peroxidase-family protein